MHSTPYSGPESIDAMRGICIALRNSGIDAAHTGDINWAAHMHVEMNPKRDTRIWWDGAMPIAYSTFIRKYGLELQLAPAHLENGALLDDILAQAHEHSRQFQDGSPANEIPSSCPSTNPRLLSLMRSRGFTEDGPDACLYSLSMTLAKKIPEKPLPPGVEIRPVAEHELAARAQIHRDVWNPSKVTLEGYRITRSAPHYNPDFDMAVVMPDGTLAAYCICWLEPETHTIRFEPVGTRAEHRREGLGQAMLWECMRRAYAIGYHTAFVNCEAKNLLFYESLGFREFSRWIYLTKRSEQ